jgi:tetratricopeptide (TPR) repeat protein
MTLVPSVGGALRLLAASTMLLCAVPRIAHAGDAETESRPSDGASDTVTAARAHFRKGLELYQDGDFRAALIELERAYALEPRYRLLYNLGQVAYALRNYVDAEKYFTEYLEKGKDEISADRRADVEADLERLRGRIATVRFQANQRGARITVDDRVLGVAPIVTPVRLSAGAHHVTAELAGYAPVHREVEVVGGDALTVTLAFGPRLNDAPPAGPKADDSGVQWPLWTGIATGAFGIAAGALGYSASQDQKTYEAALGRRTSQAELDDIAGRARTKALLSDVFLGTAIVCGVATVILLVTGSKSENATATGVARTRAFRGDGFVF